MKKFTKFVAVLGVSAILFACGGAGGPEGVAKDYLTALKEKNYDKAKTLGTEDTQQMLDALIQFGAAPVVEEVKDIKCEVTGEEAVCTFCCMKEGKNELKMMKKEGKWFVNEKKENPMEGAFDDMDFGDLEMEEGATEDTTEEITAE
jgi:hypothetical protein